MITFDKNKDYIAIIAPASKPLEGRNKIIAIEKLLTDHGFNCLVDENILAGDCLNFFAASRKIRLATFTEAMQNARVKIILQARGGYGGGEFIFDCLRLKASGPKIFIGFSDGTALHYLFNQCYNMPSIHGNIINSKKFELTIDADLIKLLEGNEVKLHLNPLNGIARENTQMLSGITAGGNLTLVCNMIGTKLPPHAMGKILILEDVNEKGYHVHRHLMHLKNANILKGVKAIVFADFTSGDEHLQPAIEQFCTQHIAHVPAYRTEGIGHGEINKPFTLGAQAYIKNDILTIDSPFNLI